MDPHPDQTPSAPAVRGFRIARAAIALVMVAACQAAPAAAPSPGSTAQPPDTGFPRTLVDDDGTPVTIDEPPDRIISLSPAITETVFALGAGDRLVGGTDFDDHPPEAAELPDVATFTGVLMEQVIDTQPDLVLAAGNNFTPPADIRRMRELGMKVVVTYAESFNEVMADVELIGQAIGADGQAAEIVDGMEERLREVTEAVATIDETPRVFYQISSAPEIFGPAPQSFIADMVALAGGDPITTTDPTVFSISVERLVEQDPEVIVVGDANYGVCPADVAARPGWSQMTAVREGEIRPVDDTIVTRPGPRLAEGLAALALAIHPEADVAPPAGATDICPEG